MGQSGALLGGADRADANGFYGAAEPAHGRRLTAALPPPDLVIQDELHLIAGPLGTMAGLYETAIEALAVREVDGQVVKPKIVASTATVRRAQDQIQALFARGLTQVFPPPGPNRRDTFFARTVPSSETPARRYVGIASQGRNPKVLMRRVLLALMGAAQQAWHDAGGDGNPRNPADPYMTALADFNSLRELVLGQPKVHAEYIQATSRAGRSDEGPGLVVTLLNVHKPRDRSHYERFRHYHETFYRSVEAGSVTPFSPRALDRGFAGALVALARHLEPGLTPPRGVERIGDVRAALEPRLLAAFEALVAQQAFAEDTERDERAGPRARPPRLVAAGLRRLSRGRGRAAVPVPGVAGRVAGIPRRVRDRGVARAGLRSGSVGTGGCRAAQGLRA